jgi:hypothetical protein
MKPISVKLFFFCALFFILEGNAKTIFVKTDGKGNGESWENALSNLQLAIGIATESDQIWVKMGIYYPTRTNNRQIPFLIDKSVQIFGGFSGSEKDLKERDFEQFQTIISGEIGDKTSVLDNSYNIFLIDIEKGDIVLDGITLQRGMANISSDAYDRKHRELEYFIPAVAIKVVYGYPIVCLSIINLYTEVPFLPSHSREALRLFT